MSNSIDGELADWSTLADSDWSTLLLGNGLSMNVWAGFGYKSLYAAAKLSDEAKAIFNELGTTNFEQCLECLHHANIALRALKDPTVRVDNTYDAVKDALFNTVGEVHVPWGEFPTETHDLCFRDRQLPLGLHDQLRPHPVLESHVGRVPVNEGHYEHRGPVLGYR